MPEWHSRGFGLKVVLGGRDDFSEVFKVFLFGRNARAVYVQQVPVFDLLNGDRGVQRVSLLFLFLAHLGPPCSGHGPARRRISAFTSFSVPTQIHVTNTFSPAASGVRSTLSAAVYAGAGCPPGFHLPGNAIMIERVLQPPTSSPTPKSPVACWPSSDARIGPP